MLSSTDHEPGDAAAPRHAPPRGHRDHRGIGCDCSDCLGGKRANFDRRSRRSGTGGDPGPGARASHAACLRPSPQDRAGARPAVEAGRAMIWRTLRHDFWWKFGSLVAAVLLWFSIVGEQELVTMRSAPILYQKLPPDLLIGA